MFSKTVRPHGHVASIEVPHCGWWLTEAVRNKTVLGRATQHKSVGATVCVATGSYGAGSHIAGRTVLAVSRN